MKRQNNPPTVLLGCTIKTNSGRCGSIFRKGKMREKVQKTKCLEVNGRLKKKKKRQLNIKVPLLFHL